MSVATKIKLFHRSAMAMNTQLDVIFWGCNLTLCENVFSEIQEQLQQLELILSRYAPQSETYRLNNAPKKKEIKISQGLCSALDMAANYHLRTLGYFDLRLGNAYHGIKHQQDDFVLPKLPYHESLVLDLTRQSVVLNDAAVSIDFGAMGKGLAMSGMARCIDRHQINNAFVSFGGSTVLTRGRHPHGNFWPFSLAEKGGHFAKVWQLNKHAVSVSSSRTKLNNELRYHIFNPLEQKTISEAKTVVVQNNHPSDAEVLSTALLAAPIEKHSAIIANFKDCNIDIF